MKLYDRSLMIDIIETKLLEYYSEYYPQGQYNNMFIKYLYLYLKHNTFSGEHYILLQQLIQLKEYSNTLIVEESTDKQTFTLTDINGISNNIISKLKDILRYYNNYEFIVKSTNRIVFKVNFGWLPPNAGSWLNLLNDETIIDYYIDGITLKPNTHTQNTGIPDSGYICYKIDSISEYNTILFLIDKDLNMQGDITFASLLNEIEGTKGATLNRIVSNKPENAFYELGPYNQNYLSAESSALIIQVPYNFAISDAMFVFDVSNSVLINNQNNPTDPNDSINWFIPFSIYNEKYFIYNNINIETINKIVDSRAEILDLTLYQYILGDFIWKTSDSKLIAYIQNLISSLYPDLSIKSDGVWSDKLSEYIRKFKADNNIYALFDDDVVDKSTEEIMLTNYKLAFNLDPNDLFNQW